MLLDNRPSSPPCLPGAEIPAEAADIGGCLNHRLPTAEAQLADGTAVDRFFGWPTTRQNIRQQAGHRLHEEHPLAGVVLRAKSPQQLGVSRGSGSGDEGRGGEVGHGVFLRRG